MYDFVDATQIHSQQLIYRVFMKTLFLLIRCLKTSCIYVVRYDITFRDEVSRIEEESRMEMEKSANTDSDDPITSLSEEQKDVYQSALDGYVLKLILLLHRICFLQEMLEQERVMCYDSLSLPYVRNTDLIPFM